MKKSSSKVNIYFSHSSSLLATSSTNRAEMGSFNSAMSKCEFTIYKGVSEHKCEKRKWKYHTFYEYAGSNKTDKLNVVESPRNYSRRRIHVQANCKCEKTVRLSVVNQVAKSFHFNPGMVYNYTDKIQINTDYGFTCWVYENTRAIRSESEFVDSFVAALMPGTLFYDGVFMTRIANECSTLSAQDSSSLIESSEHEDHRCKFVKLIEFCSDLTRDSFVVNKISRPCEN